MTGAFLTPGVPVCGVLADAGFATDGVFLMPGVPTCGVLFDAGTRTRQTAGVPCWGVLLADCLVKDLLVFAVSVFGVFSVSPWLSSDEEFFCKNVSS